MANILILSLVFPPDNVSTAHIMGDLAVDLKASGNSVFVITTVPHYNDDVKAEARQPLRGCLGKLLQKSDYFGMEVLHVWMPRKGKSKLLRMAAWLGFHGFGTIAGILGSFKPDVILAPSPPLTIGISAWLIGVWHKCHFIYNVQEIYPDVAVNLGVLKNRLVIRIFEGLESFVYEKAGALAVISEGMAKRVREKGVRTEKVHVIPNFVDIDDFKPLPKVNEFSLSHGLQNKFVVSYAGNMGKPQGLDVFIEAANLLRDEPEIHFLMMGDGSERERLIEQAKRLKLQNTTILPYQPYDTMAEAYATADASFVPQAPGTSNDGIPSKIYRIMACARPVIASTDLDSDIASLVTKSDVGAVVRSGDSEALARAVKNAHLHYDAWMEKGAKARETVIQGYSRSAVSSLYQELMVLMQKQKRDG